MRYVTFLLLMCLSINKIFAIDLLGSYQQAMEHDPTFQMATSTRLSAAQLAPISHAALVPTIDINGDSSYTQNNSGNPSRFGTVADYSLSLKQPLFNYANWINYQASEAKVKAANASYIAALQDLIARVTISYFAVLRAEQTLHLANVNNELLVKRLHQTQLQFKAGLSKTADIDNAQAAVDNSRAVIVHAENTLTDTKSDLEAMTAVSNQIFARLKASFPLQHPNPNNIGEWLRYADLKNLTVISDRYAALAAQQNIRQQQAGNYPTLNGAIAYSGNVSRNNGIANTNSHAGAANLSLDFPIYQGGLVTAETKQAQYDYQTALGQAMKDGFAAKNQIQKSFNGILNDIQAINIDKEAIASNERSFKSTEIAYQAGTRNMLDLLSAQQTLFAAEEVYVKDRYQYFTDFINLKEAAGLLSIVDLQLINHWLTEER